MQRRYAVKTAHRIDVLYRAANKRPISFTERNEHRGMSMADYQMPREIRRGEGCVYVPANVFLN